MGHGLCCMLAFLICHGYSFVKDLCLVGGHMFKFQVFILGLMFKFQVYVLVLCFVDVSSSCKFCLCALLMPPCIGRSWLIGFRF